MATPLEIPVQKKKKNQSHYLFCLGTSLGNFSEGALYCQQMLTLSAGVMAAFSVYDKVNWASHSSELPLWNETWASMALRSWQQDDDRICCVTFVPVVLNWNDRSFNSHFVLEGAYRGIASPFVAEMYYSLLAR